MSVRKRQWTTAKGVAKESWVVDYVDQSGKRHIKTFARKKDADRAAVSTMTEVHAGVHTAHSGSKTVSEAAELWLSACEANGLERTTIVHYRQHVDLHINPFLGRERLSQLTAPMIRAFEENLRKGTPAPGEKEGHARSAAIIKKIICSLGGLIGDAQELGLVARNVVRELRSRRPRGKQRRAERRQKGKLQIGVHIPTRAEIKAIIINLNGHNKPLMLTAIFTGLRASELRGLRWRDIDFARKELNVRQRADRFKQIGNPKSEAGFRTVPFSSMVAKALREWKLACPKTEEDLVFPSKKGNVEYHSNIVKTMLWPALIAAGVTVPKLDKLGAPVLDKSGDPVLRAKYTGLHALRHFFASWCINRKEDGGLELPPKVVQERLGHSTITMTFDTYGHLFPREDDGSQMEAAERSLLA